MSRPQVIHYQTRMQWLDWKHTYMRWTACGLQFTSEVYLYSPDARDATCKRCLRVAQPTATPADGAGSG